MTTDTMEMTMAETVVVQAEHWGDHRFTPDEMAAALGTTARSGGFRNMLNVLFYAGVLDREYIPRLGGYRYWWLGAGPGGVR